jgi:hypothetical protein
MPSDRSTRCSTRPRRTPVRASPCPRPRRLRRRPATTCGSAARTPQPGKTAGPPLSSAPTASPRPLRRNIPGVLLPAAAADTNPMTRPQPGRERAIDGIPHSSTLVTGPRSDDRTCTRGPANRPAFTRPPDAESPELCGRTLYTRGTAGRSGGSRAGPQHRSVTLRGPLGLPGSAAARSSWADDACGNSEIRACPVDLDRRVVSISWMLDRLNRHDLSDGG